MMTALPQPDQKTPTDWRVAIRVASASAILLALVLGGVGVLFAPDPRWLGAGCVVAALIGFGAYVAAPRQQKLNAERRTEAAFDALFHEAAQPALLTDDTGRVLSANLEATAGAGDVSGPIWAGEVLSQWDPEADAVVYRVFSHLDETWTASERLGEDPPLELRARRVAEGRVLWTVSQTSDSEARGYDSAPFAYAELDADGRVEAQTRVFTLMPPVDAETIVREAFDAYAMGSAASATQLPGGRRVAASLHQTRTGEYRLFAFPDRPDGPDRREVIFENLPVPLARLTIDGDLLSVNAAGRVLLGEKARPGLALESLLDGLGRTMAARIAEAADGLSPARPELARGETNDKEIFLQMSLTRLDDGDEATLLAVLNDATELKTLEQQFVQSQKMQAVGQLAGGVAHDFNNLLTAILGHCDLLMMRINHSSPEFADLSQIRQNANRAAGLVRQLLAFSRKQTLRPEAVKVTDAMSELLHLLNRLLGERITMRIENDDDIWPVWIDGQQFEQVVMNLVVNARDAMPDGGEVILRAYNRRLPTEVRRDRAVIPPGDYVCVEVKDTGVGIRMDRLDKIFEPFFTTKRQGEGTGLGLSTAYGIVKQTGGFIFADSAVGVGSTFTIYLPRLVVEEAPQPLSITQEKASDLTGSERILLVEDEAPVRAFASRALKLRGYDVLEAESAEVALEILEDDDVYVDLMVSDVVMPGLDGPSWVRLARQKRPDVGVVFMSGYAEDAFRRGMDGVENYHFLAKPFSLDDLAKVVKQALEGEPPDKVA